MVVMMVESSVFWTVDWTAGKWVAVKAVGMAAGKVAQLDFQKAELKALIPVVLKDEMSESEWVAEKAVQLAVGLV